MPDNILFRDIKSSHQVLDQVRECNELVEVILSISYYLNSEECGIDILNISPTTISCVPKNIFWVSDLSSFFAFSDHEVDGSLVVSEC